MKNSYMKNFLLFAFSVALNFIFVACTCLNGGNETAKSANGTGNAYYVSTLAGNKKEGFADGRGTSVKFLCPQDVAVDHAGNVYVADRYNNRIRKIDSIGRVSTLAGDGSGEFTDGRGTSAKFFSPYGIAIDNMGNVYVADMLNHRIRKIDTTGRVSTLAGDGSKGFIDGSVTIAKFSYPTGVAIDDSGNVYVADSCNHRIRKIDTTGRVSTLAGSEYGFADGFRTVAKFNNPNDVAVDNAGNVYVADASNNRIRKIDTTGLVSTLAGSEYGFADGSGTTTKFYEPSGVTLDNAGNIYVADTYNHRIRKIDSSGNVSTLAGDGSEGFSDGSGTVAKFGWPYGVAVDSTGNVYVADTYNHRIRKITQGTSTKANGD